MLAGYQGHLLSEQFLEQHLGEVPGGLDARDKRAFHLWRLSCAALGPASSLRAMLETGAAPLASVLGFEAVAEIAVDANAATASLTGGSRCVALLVTHWGAHLDSFWRQAIVDARRRLASWCLLFNGTHLRLIETSRVYSRRYLEFDIDLALDDDEAGGALWRVFNASSLETGATDGSSLSRLMQLSDSHAAGVSRALKEGVRSASARILDALLARRAPPPVDTAFEQGLTIVYRLLFLLFAEARGLAPLWHPVYRESYSVAAMRDAAEDGAAAIGLWDTLRAASRMAHAGCRAGSLRVTAFNGRLFAPSRTPLIDRHDLDDEAARDAILALSTRPAADRSARERIAYRDLGVEQLGAVYESLLDYQPRLDPPSAHNRLVRPRVALSPGSDRRKATGTFYTPQSIADYLTRRTLAPLVANAEPGRILALRVVDPAMGSGAFLVSACRFLAQAYESALVRTGACHSSDLGPEERAGIRRTIAERCLYGVDANPMAVQLARLSLWLATLSSGKPLSFLDHHLQVGDSLLGAWVSSLRHAPAPVRRERPGAQRSLPLFGEDAMGAAMRDALPVRFSLEAVPDDTAERVRLKERALAALNQRQTLLSKWKRVADLWCGRWFSPQLAVTAAVFRELSEGILSERSAVPAAAARPHLVEAERIAAGRRFFHWELEFPEVFFEASGARLADGGFDAVLGNPPWEMIRADSGGRAARADARAGLDSWLRFTRDSGVYVAQSAGHANCYQLFVERAIALARRNGRIGLVLPGGFALDHGSARLRRKLFADCAVDSIVGFDNRKRVFPIHRSVRFLLVTATSGTATGTFGCRLGESDAAVLEAAGDEPAGDPWFPVRLSPALLKHLSGDDLTVPDVRAPIDLAIAERAASLYPPLGDPGAWHVQFGRELNATDNRDVLLHGARGLPVVEGKDLEPFVVRADSARWSIRADAARRLLGTRHERPRLAYRDVASATNRQTLIAALIPPRMVSTHTIFCIRTALQLREQYFLCALFNSFVVNYLVRLRVATHVTTAIVERLPIPREDDAPGVFEKLAATARLLGRTRSEAHRSALLAQLNARVARLYQLTRAEFAHVLSSFPLTAPEERDGAMREFLR